MATISHRLSIAWPPNPPSEPTDTLVLHFPDTSVFLDLRIDKSTKAVNWAFAGVDAVLEDDETRKKVAFYHYIDSKHPDRFISGYGTEGSLEEDKGWFVDENGIEIETGEMINPDSHSMQPYIERWGKLPVSQNASYILLETLLPNDGGRGFLGKVDQYMLGMAVDTRIGFFARRWDLVEDHWVLKHDVSRRIHGSEDILVIPEIPAELEKELKVGEQVELGAFKWTVKERFMPCQ